ncbi:hypothetical protein EHQ76_07015 [Leptospira barantonii]|uniref:Uncharacterized protein n=1 Tax=Leptospira barantonii TaxID=2023184 RepID=A0A5F2BKB0_9LEPT|nr:hypothetical protein [Leptospira barantonii]TGM06009.1 hypothetical protein EHQ76_07015 [Leptospira barantonii]
MKTIFERFTWVENYFGHTTEQVANNIGCKRTRYYSYKTGEEMPDHRWDKFEKKYKIRREWILTGKGPKEIDSKNPDELLMQLSERAKPLTKLNAFGVNDLFSEIPDDLSEEEIQLFRDLCEFYVQKVKKSRL